MSSIGPGFQYDNPNAPGYGGPPVAAGSTTTPWPTDMRSTGGDQQMWGQPQTQQTNSSNWAQNQGQQLWGQPMQANMQPQSAYYSGGGAAPPVQASPYSVQQPSYLSGQFPYGVPTTSPATVGNIPQINAPQLFGGYGTGGPQTATSGNNQGQAQGASPYTITPAQQQAAATAGPSSSPYKLGDPMPQNSTNPDGTPSMAYLQWYGSQQPTAANQPQMQQMASQAGVGGSGGSGVPQVQTPNIMQPQNVNAQQLGTPQSIVGAMGGPQAYSPNASVNAISSFLAPQFNQQNHALQEALASSGIVGGTTGKAMADLGQQQQTTLQNDIQPYVLQRQQMQQQATTQDVGNQMQSSISNQVADLQAQGMNQQTALHTAIQNAANQLQASGMNSSQAIQVAQENARLSMQGQIANQGTALQASEFNAGSLNAANQFDVSNLIKSGQMDSQTYNQFLQYVMGLQNQDWLAQGGWNNNIANQGQNNQTSAFQPNYQQPGAVNLGGIAGAFAPKSNAGSPPPPPIPQGSNGGGFPA